MEGLKFIKLQKGQTLVEVAIALALATIVITALLSTNLFSLSSAENSQSQNEATNYSQQGLEYLRSLGKIPVNGTYCLGSDNTPIESPECTVPNLDSKYIRQVIIEDGKEKNCGTILKHVTVTTSWDDGKCGGTYCKKSSLESCFSNI